VGNFFSQNETVGNVALVFSVLVLCSCSNPRLFIKPEDVPPKTVSLSVHGFCPTSLYNLSGTFAFNASTIIDGETVIPDYDRDGLPDRYETSETVKFNYDLSWRLRDTDGDGYDDLWIYRNNVNRSLVSTLQACLNPLQDSDLDGINNCSERILRTDESIPDFDGDDIPDGLEFRFGLNPSDSSDADTDPDDDGLTNLQEVMANTRYDQSNLGFIKNRELQYKLSTTLRPLSGENCHDIRVSNIPILPMENGNLLQLQVIEKMPNNPSQNGSLPTQIRTVMILVLDTIADKSVIRIEGATQLRAGVINNIGDSPNNPVVLE
jgi:hypothetical protein